MTKVIAISSISGGGKTTVVNALKRKFSDSLTLSFDDYNFDSGFDYGLWLARGGDYNYWDLTPLKRDVESLLNNFNLEYIFLDYPFAYRNDMLKPYIDFAIYIDTPLDIALARRVLRDMKNSSGNAVIEHMDRYLQRERLLYQYMLDTIPCNSDLTVNGNQSVERIVTDIMDNIFV